MKKLLCKIGWHRFFPTYPRHWKWIEFDGASAHVKCGWCGYEGMIDSQGNLF